MTKNYMEEVAQLLGVELEEEFKIKKIDVYRDYVYRFDVNYLLGKNNSENNWFESDLLGDLLNGTYEIEKTILTTKEKEYLSAVIRPFKDRIVGIKKNVNVNNEYIVIKTKLDGFMEYTPLPSFAHCTMYKGMEPSKEYSLEELGL